MVAIECVVVGQATFTIPASMQDGSTGGHIQLRHSSASSDWKSNNYTFEYYEQQPHVQSVVLGSADSKVQLDIDDIAFVASQGLPLTFTIHNLNAYSTDDISIILSSDGTSLSLAATRIELLTCDGSSGCEAEIVLSPPTGSPEGTKVLTFASKRCPTNQVSVNTYNTFVKAVPVPSHVSSLGGDTVALYIENAPHSPELPFITQNVVAFCTPVGGTRSVQLTVQQVHEWTKKETVVILRSPPGGGTSEADTPNQIAVTCQVYRAADDDKVSGDFLLTLYKAGVPYIEEVSTLEAEAVGSQLGGKQMRVDIHNFPQIQVRRDDT
jgi:hypothetical protein